jgi:4-amino-4-deoxy-L-arabinose transferase-like glycosyltransferase
MNLTRNRTIALLAAISVLGFGLRLYTAHHVFPAQGDAGHFVQHGVAFAHGVRPHISGFWALFPQIVAYGAANLGRDPLRSLQLFTVLCGSIVVFSSGALAWGLTRRPLAGVVCAMLVATNYSLIDISATGLSEPGYLACLLSGSALWAHSIASGRKIGIAAGMTIVAAALFFKTY